MLVDVLYEISRGARMAGVKTAISLDEELFDQVNALADRMNVSRSRVCTLALRDYLKKQENVSLLARLNEVYADGSDTEERTIARTMKAKHRSVVGKEPW